MTDLITVRDQGTGAVFEMRRSLFNKSYFNRGGRFIEVPAGSKSYIPEMFKSRLKEPAVDPASVADAPEEISEVADNEGIEK